MKLKPREYARRVQRASPPSPLGKDCLWAFFVGGGICLLGEVLRQWYLAKGLEAELGRVAGAHHGLCQRGGQRGH